MRIWKKESVSRRYIIIFITQAQDWLRSNGKSPLCQYLVNLLLALSKTTQKMISISKNLIRNK